MQHKTYARRVRKHPYELLERHLANLEALRVVDRVHARVLELGRVLAAFVRVREQIPDPPVLRRVQLRLVQSDYAEWDEEEDHHDIAVHLPTIASVNNPAGWKEDVTYPGVRSLAYDEPVYD